MFTLIKKTLAYLLSLTFLIWICGFIAFFLHVRALQPEHPEQKTDAIIVLTGGNLRVGTGLSLFAENMAPKLFISGVHNSVSDQKIRSMWNSNNPLPECCITLGHDATTTIGNAEEVYHWIRENKINTIRLVTSNYHMPRAMLELDSALAKLNTKNIVNPIIIIKHPVNDKGTKNYASLLFNEYNKALFRWSVLTLGKQV